MYKKHSRLSAPAPFSQRSVGREHVRYGKPAGEKIRNRNQKDNDWGSFIFYNQSNRPLFTIKVSC